MASGGGLDGAFWSILFGMVFFVFGLAPGALADNFRDYGINDD
jgi:uncharacterized membrane protein